ncbi:MAG: hypothetical protein JW841_01700 [Deltaproteobacteria bacterium]|nr:hypothetical protein [Deltaproteobacteria bacterium]
MANLYEAQIITPAAKVDGPLVVFDAGAGGASAMLIHFKGPQSWTASLAPGNSDFSCTARLWESDEFIVVVHGQAYLIDAITRELKRYFGGFVEGVLVIPHLDLLVYHNGLWVEGLFSSGYAWQTTRLSWDGFRHLKIDGDDLIGEAYDPISNSWHDFTVDLSTGEAVGGSYQPHKQEL